MKIILASKSPRRKELLEQVGINPCIMVSDVDENIGNFSPEELVKRLSCIKAKAVFEQLSEDDFVVIGADTVVYADGEILGKPKNKEDAFRMINLLQGSVHEVFTGFCIIDKTGRIINDYAVTKVYVYPMTDKEINDYIDTREPYDKAGGYGIQGLFGRYVEKIDGDYNNVVGLPVSRILHELNSFFA